MKKNFKSIALMLVAAAATVSLTACNGQTAAGGSNDSLQADTVAAEAAEPANPMPKVEALGDGWERYTYADKGVSFELPEGLKAKEDEPTELRDQEKDIFLDCDVWTSDDDLEGAKAFLKARVNSIKANTKEQRTELKDSTATAWEHKNGMQHHTRYIWKPGRYVEVEYYYFDKKKDECDKTAERVMKSVKFID
ncbi:MAG: hypothetical protein IJ729_00910 [Alloprevotella sp.]|nr:hypothetical protein [Alloprevotella sp.]